MNSRMTFYVMLGLLAVMVLGLFGGAYGVNSLLEKEAAKEVSLKAEKAAQAKQQIALTKAKQDIKKYAQLEQIAKAVVPQDKDQAEAVREIVKLADDNNIKLGSISFPASSLGGTATGTSAGTSSASGSSSAKLSQLRPVKGITGVYDLQIVVQSDSKNPVPYSKIIGFLTALEHNRRTAQVSAITLTPDNNNPSLLGFSLTLDEYIKP